MIMYIDSTAQWDTVLQTSQPFRIWRKISTFLAVFRFSAFIFRKIKMPGWISLCTHYIKSSANVCVWFLPPIKQVILHKYTYCPKPVYVSNFLNQLIILNTYMCTSACIPVHVLHRLFGPCGADIFWNLWAVWMIRNFGIQMLGGLALHPCFHLTLKIAFYCFYFVLSPSFLLFFVCGLVIPSSASWG